MERPHASSQLSCTQDDQRDEMEAEIVLFLPIVFFISRLSECFGINTSATPEKTTRSLPKVCVAVQECAHRTTAVRINYFFINNLSFCKPWICCNSTLFIRVQFSILSSDNPVKYILVRLRHKNHWVRDRKI